MEHFLEGTKLNFSHEPSGSFLLFVIKMVKRFTAAELKLLGHAHDSCTSFGEIIVYETLTLGIQMGGLTSIVLQNGPYPFSFSARILK